MKIGEVAKMAGVGIDTVRYYERIGILTAKRRPSGYRAFTKASVERLRFARELQTLGFSLEEIRLVLREVDRGTRGCDQNPSAFDAVLARIEEKIAELQATRRRLRRTVRDCRNGRCLLVERAARLSSS